MNWRVTIRYFFIPAFALFLSLKISAYVNNFIVEHTKSGEVKSSGEAAIGGSFRLVDQNGKIVRDTDFRNKLMLVYFGFSYCPDICPVDLVLMSNIMLKLHNEAKYVQPLFITVDPNRDTPEQLKSYLSNFYPGIIGLTGTPGEIADIANKYHIFYKKVKDENLSDYKMDHSAFIYLMGKDGKYITHFDDKQDIDKIVAEIRKGL